MSAPALLRWRGIALAIGGVGIALFMLTLYPLGNPFSPNVLLTSQSLISHLFHTVGAFATLFGLEGLYVRQKERAGQLGLIGFILAFAGTAFSFTGGLVAAFIFPPVAASAPAVLDPKGPFFSGLGSVPFLLLFVLSLAGYGLLGLATLRAGVFARAAAWLLIVGAILLNLPIEPAGPTPLIVSLIGAISWSAAVIWLGWELWTMT